jgi:hypothetical protein
MFDIDRGGKWREQDQPAVTDLGPRSAKLADALNKFLIWHQEAGGEIWNNFNYFVLQHNFAEPEKVRFRSLLSMYIHKYARHLRHVDEAVQGDE